MNSCHAYVVLHFIPLQPSLLLCYIAMHNKLTLSFLFFMSAKSHCLMAKCRNQSDLCEGLRDLFSWIRSQLSGIALVLAIPYCLLVSSKAFAMTCHTCCWVLTSQSHRLFLQPQMYFLCRACHQLMDNVCACSHRLVSSASPRNVSVLPVSV